MNFRQWLEHKWHEFKDTVTLYHGTSSMLISNIQKEGLKLPGEDLEEFALKIIKQYTEPTPEIIKYIKNNVLDFRKDTQFQKVGNAIYLTTDFDDASGYAQSYHKNGGEIAHDIWRAINNKHPNNLNALQRDVKIIFPPVYKDAKPVVIEVEIPFEWMKTYHDLKGRYQMALDNWEVYGKKEYDNFNKFVEVDFGQFEVRVMHDIPPSMIRKIHSI